MRRIVFALLLTGCFEDPEPVDDGAVASSSSTGDDSDSGTAGDLQVSPIACSRVFDALIRPDACCLGWCSGQSCCSSDVACFQSDTHYICSSIEIVEVPRTVVDACVADVESGVCNIEDICLGDGTCSDACDELGYIDDCSWDNTCVGQFCP